MLIKETPLERGDNGIFITLVPKVSNTVIRWVILDYSEF